MSGHYLASSLLPWYPQVWSVSQEWRSSPPVRVRTISITAVSQARPVVDQQSSASVRQAANTRDGQRDVWRVRQPAWASLTLSKPWGDQPSWAACMTLPRDCFSLRPLSGPETPLEITPCWTPYPTQVGLTATLPTLGPGRNSNISILTSHSLWGLWVGQGGRFVNIKHGVSANLIKLTGAFKYMSESAEVNYEVLQFSLMLHSWILIIINTYRKMSNYNLRRILTLSIFQTQI